MRTDVHKLAVNNFLRPDAPVSIVLQGSIDDDRLLAGSVPQPSDWLRAWKICGNPQSWAAAAADADLENYVHQLRARGVPSRGIEKMVEVMHEVVRMPKRQWLRDCMSIWLSFDDRAGFKLMRFSCDALDAPLGSRQGVLGCVNILEGITLEELDEDYAKRVASEVERMIRRFCTPLGDDMDVALFNKICRATRGLVTDKALMKATHVLKLDLCRMWCCCTVIQRTPFGWRAKALCNAREHSRHSPADCSQINTLSSKTCSTQTCGNRDFRIASGSSSIAEDHRLG